MHLSYRECALCARKCLVNREAGERGFCREGTEAHIARAALHEWEEPIISGTRGSGTVFFSGCSLGCKFCQNSAISRAPAGELCDAERLSEIMLSLESAGAHNINFVTPTHIAPTVKAATLLARERGLSLPTVYNTSSYDTPKTIREISDVIDIYLADYKFHLPKTAALLANANDYPTAAKAAIEEMVRQKPTPIIRDGLMMSGVIVRILLLPMHVAEAKLILKYLYDTYGDSIYISLMSQYTPMNGMPPPLDRRVTAKEYSELVKYAERLGVKNCFFQERSSASEKFIPPFK